MNKKSKMVLAIIALGFVIGGWSLWLQGKETLALLVFSVASTGNAVYWINYIVERNKEKKNKSQNNGN